jgi:hypothetical protein
MRTVPIVILGLVATMAACSSPADPEPEIDFRKVPNVALYQGADYPGMLLSVRSQGSVEDCKRLCRENRECTFFYFNERGGMILPVLTTQKDDCAFFRGKLWVGTANNTDTYVKQVDGVDAWDL